MTSNNGCILLTIAFAFDDFESLLKNFGLILTSSKFGNFRLGDGERRKSQYRSYLLTIFTKCLPIRKMFKMPNLGKALDLG